MGMKRPRVDDMDIGILLSTSCESSQEAVHRQLTSENTIRSRLLPSGLNLTTRADSLPLLELPVRGIPVTGSTSIW